MRGWDIGVWRVVVELGSQSHLGLESWSCRAFDASRLTWLWSRVVETPKKAPGHGRFRARAQPHRRPGPLLWVARPRSHPMGFFAGACTEASTCEVKHNLHVTYLYRQTQQSHPQIPGYHVPENHLKSFAFHQQVGPSKDGNKTTVLQTCC